MTQWNIDSAHGNSMTQGIATESEARNLAQRTANRLGESVYIYEARTIREDESEETPDTAVDAEEIQPVCDAEGKVYRVKFSNGVERGPFVSYDLAEACVKASYPNASIGHDGDISDGGARTLCWESEEDGEDDDGEHAVASIHQEDF